MKTVAIVSVLAGTASVSAQVPVEWPVAEGGNGHWYLPVSESALIDWTDSNAAAEAAGGYLATLTSAAENAFVFDLSGGSPYWTTINSIQVGPWVGGIQLRGSPEPGGGWTWVTSEPWTFDAWAGGQPNNANGDQDRVGYWAADLVPASTWNDAPADSLHPSYVVEWDEAPCISLPEVCDQCAAADLDQNGAVETNDLLILLGFWGPCSPLCLGDINGDGIVGTTDLLELLANWGLCA